MKVTFMIYRYSTGTIDLVQQELKGSKPSKQQWEEAAGTAKQRIAVASDLSEEAHPLLGHDDFSVVGVLKGLVTFEPRAIDL